MPLITRLDSSEEAAAGVALPAPRGERAARWRAGLALAVLAAAACCVSLVMTARNVGYDPDSAVYLGVAHNIVDGRGPTVPITFYTDRYSPATAAAFHGAVPSTHFTPLYPAVLAGFEALGLDGTAAARVLDGLILAFNMVLFTIVLSRALVNRSWWVSAAGAVVLMVSGTWIVVHTYALSEALFLTWILAGLVLIPRYLVLPSPRTLALLSLCGAGAVLTRWVGVSFAITVATLIGLRAAWPAVVRARRAALVLGATATAGAAWALFGALAGGSFPRVLSYHPPAKAAGTILTLLADWFIHPRPPGGRVLMLCVLGAVLVLAATFTRWQRGRSSQEVQSSERAWLLVALIVFAIVYVVVVLGARTFFDASIPVVLNTTLDVWRAARIFVPLLPVALILAIAAVHEIAFRLLTRDDGGRSPARAHTWSALAAVGGCMLLVVLPVSYVPTTYRDVSDSLDARRRPALGSLTRAVRSLPSATMIVTNAPDDAYLATGRPLLIAPLRHVFVTGRTNHAFQREVSDLAAILRDRRGVLLLRSRALVDEATAADFSRYVTLVDMGHYRDWGLYRVLG